MKRQTTTDRKLPVTNYYPLPRQTTKSVRFKTTLPGKQAKIKNRKEICTKGI